MEREMEGSGHCGHDLDSELKPEDSLTYVHTLGQESRPAPKTTTTTTTPQASHEHHHRQFPTPSSPSPGAVAPSLYSSSPPQQSQPQSRTGTVIANTRHAAASDYSASIIMQQRRGIQGPLAGPGPGGYEATARLLQHQHMQPYPLLEPLSSSSPISLSSMSQHVDEAGTSWSSLPPPQRPSPPGLAVRVDHGRRDRQQDLGAAAAGFAPSSSSPLARYSQSQSQSRVHGQDLNSHMPPTPSPSSSRPTKRQDHHIPGNNHKSRGALDQNASAQTWEAASPTRGDGDRALGRGAEAPLRNNGEVVSSRSFFSEAPPRPIPFVPGPEERESVVAGADEAEEADQNAEARQLLVTARHILEEAGALAVQIRGQGLGRRTAFVDGTRDRARVLREQLRDVQASLRLLEGMEDCDVVYDDLFDVWFGL